MAGLDNLDQGSLPDIFRRLRDLETQAGLNGSSIGALGLRVHSGGMITIENGGLTVTGTANIIGSLIASGTIDFTGDVTISGPLDVSGLVTLMSDLVVASGGKITAGSIELNPDGSAKFGSMEISPAGKITSGSAEINPDGSAKFGDTTVSAAGVITSGNTIIDPDASNGGFTFLTGGGVGGSGGSVLLRGDEDAGLLASDTADLFAGATQLSIGDGSVKIDGLPTISSVGANLYMDPSTRLVYRIV